MDVFSTPFAHSCGHCILWSTNNIDTNIMKLSQHFGSIGENPCPWCGSPKSNCINDGTPINLDSKSYLWYRMTHDKKDKMDGMRNRTKFCN
jgi:hypothetical protein